MASTNGAEWFGLITTWEPPAGREVGTPCDVMQLAYATSLAAGDED